MNTNTSQIQGVEVLPGWMIGRAPLALRGIRFADNPDGGNGGENPPAPPAPAAPAAPAPPANPAPVPQPPAQPQQRHSDYDPVWAKELREEAKGYRVAGEQAEKALAEEKAAREAAEAKVAQYESEKAEQARVSSITTAAKDIANVDLLLDSGSFAKAIEGVDLTDSAKLADTVKTFVEANPHYAPAGPRVPGNQPQPTPSGGGPKGAPQTVKDAIAQHYA